MQSATIQVTPTFAQRIEALRQAKQQQTLEKQQIRGAMDFDDHAIILPPAEVRETVQTLGGSGVYFTDVILSTFKPVPNHPSGAFFGPRANGENFRRLEPQVADHLRRYSHRSAGSERLSASRNARSSATHDMNLE